LSMRKDSRNEVAWSFRPGIMFPLKSHSICMYDLSRVRFASKLGSREKRVSGKRKSATAKERPVLIAPSQ
jgi:hypothetical protein